MKIAQVSLAVHHGGAERIALDLHRAHRAAGHDACLLVGRAPADEPGSVFLDPLAGRHATVRALTGISPHLARPLAAARRWRGYDVHDQPATDRLLDHAATVLGGPPDVLHLHALAGSYLDLRQLPRLSHAVPTVLTLHDGWPLTGGAPHIGHGGPPPAAAKQNLTIKHNAFARARFHVASPSRWMLDQIPGSVLAPSVIQSHVVSHGVDPAVFNPGDRTAARRRLDLPISGHRALFVAYAAGANHSCKDVVTPIQAVLQSSTPQLALDIVGKHERRPALTASNLKYHGPIYDRQTLADHYRAADVLVHAAHAENSPTVILEALACGTPVIATAVGGIPEQIVPAVTGHLVPPRDPAAMATTLDTFFTHPTLDPLSRGTVRTPADTAAAYRRVYLAAIGKPTP